MNKTDFTKSYKVIPLISLIILLICFIFRYSYIDILGFNRPLSLAVIICTPLGFIGLLLAGLDGINKEFPKTIVKYILINTVFIFTFPLLYAAETFITPVVNPYDEVTPEKAASTAYRKDAAIHLGGHLYEWPLTMKDFLAEGYKYRDMGYDTYEVYKYGDSFNNIKPTWFTDGYNDQILRETYLVDLELDGKGKLSNQKVEVFTISSMENNWDFEIMGITLLDSVYRLETRFEDKLRADPDNKNQPLKLYYLDTENGYKITFATVDGKVQRVEVKRAH